MALGVGAGLVGSQGLVLMRVRARGEDTHCGQTTRPREYNIIWGVGGNQWGPGRNDIDFLSEAFHLPHLRGED